MIAGRSLSKACATGAVIHATSTNVLIRPLELDLLSLI